MTTEARLMKASNPYDSIISGMTRAAPTGGSARGATDFNGSITMHVDSDSEDGDDKPF